MMIDSRAGVWIESTTAPTKVFWHRFEIDKGSLCCSSANAGNGLVNYALNESVATQLQNRLRLRGPLEPFLSSTAVKKSNRNCEKTAQLLSETNISFLFSASFIYNL